MGIEDDAYFGVCPFCKQSDGILNVGSDHWIVCHKHRLRWCWGSNLIDDWRFEDEETWKYNWELIGKYVECKPYHPVIEK